MAIIGSFGGVVFEVSPDRIRTFDEMTRSHASRWAVHELLYDKPAPQFLGPGQTEISLTITLDATLGVEPEDEIKELVRMIEYGEAAPFIVGGKPIGEGDWYIGEMSEAREQITNKGRLTRATLELTLKEYPLEAVSG